MCLSSLKRSRDAVRGGGGGDDDQIAFATRFKLDVRVVTAAQLLLFTKNVIIRSVLVKEA